MFLHSGQLSGQEQDENSVSIFLGWTSQFQFAGYYAALEKGYYSELGLDVTLIPQANENGIKMVSDGTYTYGLAPGARLLSHDAFEKISVLAAIFQQSPVSLLTLKESNINTLKDLEGKKIAGGAELRAMLTIAGVNMDLVEIPGVTTDFDSLTKGEYDAISYYITDHARKIGEDSVLFKAYRPIEYGINFYGDCLFTSRSEVENNPARVENIIAATLKGWEYAIANPDEINKIIFDQYSKDWTMRELQIEAEITIHSLILPRFHDLGDMQRSKWEQTVEVLHSLGIVETKSDLRGFLYSPPGSDSKTGKLLIILGSIVVAAGIILLFLLLYNKQLKTAVALRTTSLKKANLEMDKFVYSVSHDIRSPLFSIQGIINLMRADPNGSEEYVNLIEKSVKRLNSFTGDILTYSKNSRTDLHFSVVVVDQIIDKALESMKYLVEENEIKITTHYKLKEDFCTDEWRFEVIIGNLISNAIKYGDKLKVQPEIAIHAKTNRKWLDFEISDNGIGIGHEHLVKIFDMFYRATEGSQGSGLGLYIVKETVGMLKGSISLDSTLDVGTKIRIRIPNKI